MEQYTTGGAYENAVTVTELNQFIKALLDSSDVLQGVAVKGEVSNFVAHRSGHLYFSLKDETGAVRAVMFRQEAARLRITPENGMKVIAFGSVSSYVKEGQYQLYVTALLPDGIGDLYAAVEQRRKKLAAEGLFDAARKRKLPKIPKTVGLITSPTGAAVQDMIRILGRRFPFAGVVLYPALVQGEDAPPTLIAGINCFNRLRNVDLIIIGRGGGSAEDLFAFQDESLVRAVANSAIPVISAVGHETDFTLCDFAADLRAPTPSAAAELAVPETKTLIKQFSDVLTTMARLCTQKMNSARQKLDALAQRKVLSDGKGLYREQLLRLNAASAGLDNAVRKYLDRQASAFTSQSAKLEALSPLAVLNRGYAVALKNGTPVRTVEALSVGDAVTIRLRDGTADVSVDKIGKERENNG